MSSEPASCEICGAGPRKYRCPACHIRYCGVACFSKHKTSCAPNSTPVSTGSSGRSAETSSDGMSEKAASLSAAAAAAGSALAAGVGREDSDFNITLSDAQLLRMSADEKILSMLRDRRLQEVIRAVDSAPDRAAALARARERWGADFQTFLDGMLLTVGVATRRPDGSVEFTG